ncbi:MAG: carbohydrate ABC transporter permease, partial [Chloroflexota bacterium]
MTTADRALPPPGAPTGTSPLARLVGRVGLHAGVIGLMILWLVPTIGLFVNSLRSADAVASSGWWNGIFPPNDLSLDNYASVIGQSGIVDAFINSLFITIPATVIPILVAAFAAYAFSWMNFPGRNILFVAFVG